MTWRSLMSLREAAGGGWPDTTNGAGKATLKLAVMAAKAITTLRKQHTAGLLMRGGEFRWTYQGVLATSLSTSDEAKMFTKLSLFCHPLVSYKPSHIIKTTLFVHMIKNQTKQNFQHPKLVSMQCKLVSWVPCFLIRQCLSFLFFLTIVILLKHHFMVVRSYLPLD